jgi:hypothetical protein
MKGRILKSHYDGHQILLNEPATLQPNAQLLITVLPDPPALDKEREEWFRFAAANLARAYDDDEPEYTLDDLIEVNPYYVEPNFRQRQTAS